MTRKIPVYLSLCLISKQRLELGQDAVISVSRVWFLSSPELKTSDLTSALRR